MIRAVFGPNCELDSYAVFSPAFLVSVSKLENQNVRCMGFDVTAVDKK